jgi:hypothetical protein
MPAEHSYLEDIIKKTFEEVKTTFRRPPIEGPKITPDKETTAFFDFLRFEIGINPYFVQYLAKDGKGEIEIILKGLYEHEFGHYMFFPFDLAMSLFLSYTAEGEFKEWTEEVFAYYIDFINNWFVNCSGVSKGALNKTLEANLKAAQKNGLTSTGAAIYMSLKKSLARVEGAPQLEDNIDLSKFENKADIEKAIEIISNLEMDWGLRMNYGLQRNNIKEFGKAILPLLKYDQKKKKPVSFDSHIAITKKVYQELSAEEKKEIDNAIRKLAVVLPREIYEKIKKHYNGDDGKDGIGMGIGSGTCQTYLADKFTIDYYRDLAREFGFYIRPRRMLSIGKSEMPLSITNWDPSKPPDRILLASSGGKLIPGLTKVIEDEEIPHLAEKDRIPRAVIYKDVSGSMSDPRITKCYATIATAIIALSYLRSGGVVQIALFDDGSDEPFQSTDEDQILARVCGYKGGGTALDIEAIKADLKKEQNAPYLDSLLHGDEKELLRNPLFKAYVKKLAKIGQLPETKVETDFYLVTDGGIANMAEVVEFLKSNPQYRPTIIHTGTFDLEIPGYDNKKVDGVYDGIRVLRATSKEDIITITKKSLADNLLSRYEMMR